MSTTSPAPLDHLAGTAHSEDPVSVQEQQEQQEQQEPELEQPSASAGEGDVENQEPSSQAIPSDTGMDPPLGAGTTTSSQQQLLLQEQSSAGSKPAAKPRPKPAPTTNARIRNVLAAMTKHPAAWPFLAPVREEEVPGYHATITHPMDLSTIKARIPLYLSAPGAAASGGPNKPLSKHKAAALNSAKTLAAFRADVELMFSNCFTFNAPGDVVYEAGRLLQSHLNTLLTTHQLIGPGAKKRGSTASATYPDGAESEDEEDSDDAPGASSKSKGKGLATTSAKRKGKASGVSDVDLALDAIAAAIADAQRQLEELRSTNAAATPGAARGRVAAPTPTRRLSRDSYAEAYEEDDEELEIERTPPRKRERVMDVPAPVPASPSLGAHQPQSLSSLVRRKPSTFAAGASSSYMKGGTSTSRSAGRSRANRASKPPVVVPTVCPDCNLAIVKKKCPKCRRKFIKTQYVRKPPITYAQKRELAASISDPNFPPAALKKIIKMISDSLPPTSGREGGAVELNLDILHPRTLRSLFELVNRVNGKSPEGYPLDAAGNPIVPAGGQSAGASSSTPYSHQEGGLGSAGPSSAVGSMMGPGDMEGEESGQLLDMVGGGAGPEDHSSLSSMSSSAMAMDGQSHSLHPHQQHHLYQHPSMAGVGSNAATSFYNHHQDMAAAAASQHHPGMPAYHPY